MLCLHDLVFAICFLYLVKEAAFLNNGLALTPPMGWMSWGYYMCADECLDSNKCLDESLILSVVDSFFNEGYQEAGYEYVIIDDCWSERRRINGRLVPDRLRFPRGMKFIADYVHARGLKFGMYINIAKDTCMRYPGSRGYFSEDTKQFAEWGVDYIKVDGCFVEKSYLDTAYIKLGFHLNRTGRPMVYSCSWPYYNEYIHKEKPNYSEIVPVCNLWRNYHDVSPHWAAVKYIIQHYQGRYDVYHRHHGPGHWNDPDMLLIGTQTLTLGQSKIQMAVYAMLSAPLILSCDMKMISEEERRLLQNLDLIAVGQDPLGVMARPYELSKSTTLWVKPHLPMKGDAYHSFSFALVNLDKESRDFFFTPRDYGLNYTDYTILDIFTGQFTRNLTLSDTINVAVASEDVIMYTLFPL